MLKDLLLSRSLKIMSTDDRARKWQELNKATDGWHLSLQMGLCILINGECPSNLQTLCDSSNNNLGNAYGAFPKCPALDEIT